MSKFYNKRIDMALKFAVKAHKNQVRKTEKDVPYVYHPISVGIILKDAGFSEDTVIAGILHDTIEDTGTKAETIERVFGKKVRVLVESVSEDKSLTYDERKRKYLEAVLGGGENTKAISIADALHNINSLMGALQVQGNEVWKNFSKDKNLTVTHYVRKVVAIYKKWPHLMAKEAMRQALKLKSAVN